MQIASGLNETVPRSAIRQSCLSHGLLKPFRPAGVASGMEALWRTIDTLLGVSATKAEELTIGQVCLRAVVVYIVLIAYVRFAKKRFIGQATAFDFILVIIIGSISSRAISGTAPFFASLAGTFVLILMHWIISYFSRSFENIELPC